MQATASSRAGESCGGGSELVVVVFGLDAFLIEVDFEIVRVELVDIVPIVVVEFVLWNLEPWR
ncbi:MAG TPA: hypothetical protein VHU13_02180 [Solirubrobacteraceae bacterium]|nr:hypothetical protein [Solirubrobacteraceae bacterium]